MPNLNLPTDITAGVTGNMEQHVEAAWAELNLLSRDTGLRDITSLLINGWTASTVRVRRVHWRTWWEFFGLNGSAATSSTMLNLDDTSALRLFRPSAGVESGLVRDASGTAPGYFRATPTALTCPVGYVSPGSTIRSFDHRCSAAWPTALPGAPVAG